MLKKNFDRMKISKIPPSTWSAYDFENSTFRGSDFSDMRFPGTVNFKNSDWSGANLHNFDIGRDDFSLVNLSGVRGQTKGTHLSHDELKLPPNFTLINGYLIGPGADLSGLDISSGGMMRLNVKGASFEGVDLRSSTLHAFVGLVKSCPVLLPKKWSCRNGLFLGPKINLSLAEMKGFDLTGLYLDEASMPNEENLYRVKGRLASCVNLNAGDTGKKFRMFCHNNHLFVSGADLSNANFSKNPLQKQKEHFRIHFFSDLLLIGSNFTESIFDFSIQESDLSDGIFKKVVFKYLSESNVSGADFLEAILKDLDGLVGKVKACPGAKGSLPDGWLCDANKDPSFYKKTP